MSDVILQYDHNGRVFARTTNNTLVVEADDTGLFMAADLSKTEKLVTCMRTLPQA